MSDKSYLTEDEEKRLENCAQSTSSPQLWSPDGGEPMSITDIVKGRGKAKGSDGKKYRPKKWTPVGLDSIVTKWKPTGKADDLESNAPEDEGREKCEK